MTTPQRSWQALTGDHGAGDAGLTELIAANVVGELESIASDLCWGMNCRRQAIRLRKIAEGIREAMENQE